MKRLTLALLISSLALTGAVAKQTCKERADEKKLAGAALNSFMTKCASDATAHATKQLPTRSFPVPPRTASRPNASRTPLAPRAPAYAQTNLLVRSLNVRDGRSRPFDATTEAPS